MENDFTVLLNDLQIKCNKKFVESNFPEFYQSPGVAKNQGSIQIDGGNDFYDITKDIFLGNDYDVTDDNLRYLDELSKKIKSDRLQTKLNLFCYKRECDNHQIDQHPSIQFLVELSTLIRNLSLSNYEDNSSQIKQKLIPTINENKKSNEQSAKESDQSDNSEEEEDAETEEEKEDKVLSLKMIGNKEFNKLLFFEIVNSLSTGFDSLDTFQDHQNKVDLIIQLIKELDHDNLIKLNSEEKNAFLNSFINYVIDKYEKIKNEKCSLLNYKQETKYLIHYLLSNKLITLSQIYQESDPIELYFLEFSDESQIKQFFLDNNQVTDFIKNEINETKAKSKSKKSRSDNENDETLFVDFISKNIKKGLLQNNELINVFLEDNLKRFKALFNDDSIDYFIFNPEIAEISCLSALSNCTLLELSAFFGSQKIFEYLYDKQLNGKINDSPNLSLYVMAGQHPQIIKLFLSKIDSKDSESIYQMLSFCNNHHYNDTFEMIINVIENFPQLTTKQLDSYMKRCISRSYFDIVPNLLKEGATADILLNLFSKASNEIGIEYMLEYSYINVNSPYQNKTPLEYCIDNKNERACILLLRNDFINIQDIDAKSSKGETILHNSCRLGLPKVVSYLLRKHLYDVNLPTQEGVCPIHLACLSGSYETVTSVIHAKKVHIRVKVKSGEFMKRTALHFACCSGNARIITLLLDSDSRLGLDDVDCKERTPIIYAIKGDFVDCVLVLLEQEEIDINQEYKGNNLLQYACLKNKDEVFEVLLNAIVFDPNQPCADGRVILVVAIEKRNARMVKSILDKFGRSINVNIDCNGKTPLIIACEIGDLEIARLLLDHDLINVEKVASDDGTTPLMAAARSGNVELLKLLMENEDINVHAKNKFGMTAIHFAFYAEQIEAVKFLLPLFEDNLNDTTENGETLLQIACKRGNIQLSKLLINHPGVDVNVHDNNGMTPFLSGVLEGKFELIKALIESNECNMNEKANDGRNAFLIAIQSQNLDLIKFFINLYSENHKKSTKSKSKSKSKSKGKNKSSNDVNAANDNNNSNYVDINAKTNDGRNALFTALKLKNMKILKLLINCPLIDINETSRDSTFITKIVRKLCKRNTNDSFDYNKLLDLVLEREDLDVNKPSKKYYDQTCLHVSCASPTHNMVLFKKLLGIDGIDINAESKEGTPLFLLIKYQSNYFSYDPKNDLIPNLINNNNDNDIVQTRDEYDDDENDDDENDDNDNYSENDNKTNGGEIGDENKEENCWHDFLDIPDLDVNKGGDPAYVYNKNNNNDVYNFINRRQAKNNSKSNKQEYQSPLEFAIINKYQQICDALLSKKGIDINSHYNLKKRTPLHLAINTSNFNLIQQLMSNKKINVSMQDEEGLTPLSLAISMNSSEMNNFILELLHNRGDILEGINLQDKSKGRTPFLASVFNSSTEVFNALLNLDGVDLTIKDKKGRTALYLLVKSLNSNGNESDVNKRIVMLLDKCPSLLNVPSRSGKTPLFRSINSGSSRNSSDFILYLLDQENIDLSLPSDLITPEYKSEMVKKNRVIKDYTSLLHLACFKSMQKVVEKLIPLTIRYYKDVKGIDESIFTQKDGNGNTILNMCCDRKDNSSAESINYILDYVRNNIDYNDPNEFDINYESPTYKLTPLQHICGIKETKETLEALNNILAFESLDANAASSEGLSTALHIACLNNNKNVVDWLIKQDSIDPNIYDNQGNTPLLIAVSKNESAIVKRLLRLKSIDVNSPRPLTRETPLYTACDVWNVKIVKMLLDDERTNPNCHLNLSGKTPLMQCIEKNKIDLFEIILENESIDLDAVDNDGLTILHYACRIGNVKFVKEILEKKFESSNISEYLNMQTKKGLTPLHYACLSNNKETILYLLGLNKEDRIHIDIGIVDKNNLTPFDVYLNIQSENVDNDIYKAFLNENDDKQKMQTNVNIQEICEKSHFGTIKFVISDLSFDINDNNNQMKWTLLHVICRKQKADLLKDLLSKNGSKNIDINAVDINNMTPLHHAVKVGYDSSIVKILLKTNKCDLNIKDIKGRTVLHYACQLGKSQIISELMNYSNNLDVNAQDDDGNTPLHEIANSLQFGSDIIKMLLDLGCNPNIANNEGNTVIHVACLKGNSSFISSLIELSPVLIDINAINKKYQTPLYIVCMTNNSRCFDSLFTSKLSAKIDINLTSPIYIAAMKESAIVDKLLEMPGIDLNSNKQESIDTDEYDLDYDFSGLNLMHIFSCHDSSYLLKKLISMNQYDINEKTEDYIEDKMNGTPLIIALKNQRLKNIHLILENYKSELDLSLYDTNGMAAIHYCFQMENNGMNVLKELIEIDESIVNMETKNQLKLIPLLNAFQQKNLDCVNLLLQQNSINVFSISNEDNNTPLHYAAPERNRNDIIDFVLMKIESASNKEWSEIVDFINIENDNGETALLIACKNDNYYAVKILMDKFKDSLNYSNVDNDGNTPLLAAINSKDNDLIHLLLMSDSCMSTVDISKPVNSNDDYIPQLMAKNGNLENFKLLIDNTLINASDINFDFVNVKNKAGDSLITIAADSQNVDLFNYICETQNPDLNILIDKDMPLLFKAALSYDFEIFKTILTHGVFDLNQQVGGKYLLHYAIESVFEANEKVKLIVEDENVNVNAQAKRGSMTPLHLAIKKKKVDVVETLLGLGSRVDLQITDSRRRSVASMGESSIKAIRDLFVQS